MAERRSYRLALVLSTLFLVLAAFGSGWTAFWATQEAGIDLPGLQPARSATATLDSSEHESHQTPDMALFWEAMALLEETYLSPEELPKSGDLTYAAVNGLVQATDDPHTAFMNPDRTAIVETTLEGEYEGIGAQVDMSEEGLVIVSPFPNTPAADAGLQPGDLVVEVDGEPTQGLTIMEAVARVRGPQGSSVILTVRREGETELIDFEVRRDVIVIPVTEARLIEEEGVPPIGYLRLNDFGGRATEQFKKDLQSLIDNGAERLIIDVRNNPGGYLQAAVEITSQFIDKGLILSEKGTNNREKEHDALPGGIATDIPVVVLINEGSASASEILAGAIQDSDRGTLIGTKTFGKGSVQTTHRLSDGSSIRITVARWYTPSGDAIHEVGIEPDIEVEWDRSEVTSGADQDDPQLQAAINFFKNQ